MFELDIYSMILIYNIFLTVCYVGFLYLIPQNIRKLPRNEPIHIQYRMFVVTVTTLLLICCTYSYMNNNINIELISKYINYHNNNNENSININLADTNTPNIPITPNMNHFFYLIGWRLDTAMESVWIATILMIIFYMGMYSI